MHLPDTLDAAARTLACRNAMYTALEKDYQSASLSTAEMLMTRYAALDGYLDSEQRIQSLESRFRIGLQLRSGAMEQAYVAFGCYPWSEDGLPGELIWKVIALEGETATLLCTSVIDGADEAEVPELTLTDAEKTALVALTLPTSDAAAGAEAVCSASPYALSQGIPHETDGRSWWWLEDGLLMSAGGMVVAPEEAVRAGVRPMARISLEDTPSVRGR